MAVTKSTNTRSTSTSSDSRGHTFELGDFHVVVGYANPLRLTSLTDEEVVQIKVGYMNGFSQSELARNYGVTPNTVWHIVHNQTWRHIVVMNLRTGEVL